MRDGLKPCPFCGGEAIQVSGEYRDGGYQEYTSHVKCECCGSVSQRITESCSLPEVEKIAAYAWNRRAERTCHDEAGSQQSFLCSECGWFWNDPEDELGFSYCPNCGAKVVEQ